MLEMDGAILRSLDRFVGQLVQNTWQDLSETLRIEANPLAYSGIFPLAAPQLGPFLDEPGVFLVFGPLPEVRILHLGASQTSMRSPLTSALIPGPEWSWGWRWESESNPVPTYGACVPMQGHWALVPALETNLARYLAPLLQAARGGLGGDPSFS